MGLTFESQPEEPTWHCVLEAKAQIGEVPIWSAAESRLFWIDVTGQQLNRTEPDTGETTSWSTPETVGCYALDKGDEAAVVALQSGIFHLDLGSGRFEKMVDAPYDVQRFRFNDGRCDRSGRFWVGNMPLRTPGSTDPEPIGESAFWCLDGSDLRMGFEGITVANGIAFSPAGDVMYVADRPTWSIIAFDYDSRAGSTSGRRTFAPVPEGMVPDGAAVDADGGYWIALFRAGLIARFDPDGSLDRLVKAPMSLPTMVCFGGPGLRTLFVTTARRHLDEEGLRREPLAGAIFRCDVGATGIDEPRFAGSGARRPQANGPTG
jgi:L-arabinonolactonase